MITQPLFLLEQAADLSVFWMTFELSRDNRIDAYLRY